MPAELRAALDDAALSAAWEALPPGRRRQLAEHVFAAAKPGTRARRVAGIVAALKRR